MWITRNKTARTLIWFAAITVPVQALAPVSCGCECSKSGCGIKHSKQCCCSGEKVHQARCGCTSRRDDASHSCRSTAKAGQESRGKHGRDCQCGKRKLPKPATPPPEVNAAHKVTSESTSTVSRATVYEPQVSQRLYDVALDADCLAALERCISLCSFIL